jgi:hypothetical protein
MARTARPRLAIEAPGYLAMCLDDALDQALRLGGEAERIARQIDAGITLPRREYDRLTAWQMRRAIDALAAAMPDDDDEGEEDDRPLAEQAEALLGGAEADARAELAAVRALARRAGGDTAAAAASVCAGCRPAGMSLDGLRELIALVEALIPR